MYPSGASIQQQWAAYAALSGQPGIPSGQSITINRLVPAIVDSNNMILRTLGPGLVRQTQNAPHPMPGPTVPSGPGSYPPHPALGYAFHQSLDATGGNPQFSNPYALPPYGQPGSSGHHHLSLSHSNTLPYAQSIPYLSAPLMPNICNGTLNPIAAVSAQGIPTVAPLHHHQPQHHQPHHAQQQQVAFSAAAALAAANSNSVRTFDSLKHFGALPQGQTNRRSKPMITSKTNLYISGLSESDTDDTVRSLVEKIVNPKSCKAMVISGKCKGSGFIDCASEEDAEKAKNHILEVARRTGRKLSVKYAFENEKDALNVYVRHLPRSGFTRDNLYDMFRNYGNITSVKLMEAEGCLTGIGFVRFSTAEQAERAVEQMNEAKCVMDNDKPVTCKLADKADPRRRTSTTAAVPPIRAMTSADMLAVAATMVRPVPMEQVFRKPPSRGLLAPSGALLPAAHNGAMLANTGPPNNSIGTHAVLPAHFATTPPPQPGLVANHHLLGSNLPSLPAHIGQSSAINSTGIGSVSLPLEPGVADFLKQNAPQPMVNSNTIILSDVGAPCVAETAALANSVVVSSMSTPGVYEMNGAATGEAVPTCSNLSSYPPMLPHQDTTALESKEEQSTNVTGHPSPTTVGSTSSPVTDRRQQQQQQQVFMFVSNMNPDCSPYQETTTPLASPGTASLLSQPVNNAVTSATTMTAFDSATGTAQEQHQAPFVDSEETVVETSQAVSNIVHTADVSRPRGATIVDDANMVDITSTFQMMSAGDRFTTLSSESTLESPRANFAANNNATSPHQAVEKSPNEYLIKMEHQADTYTSDNRSPQKSHTGSDAYSGAVEVTPPRRSLVPPSTATRQPVSSKKHQEASGNSVATTASNFRGRRRSDGGTSDSVNNARSKRPSVQNSAGTRGYFTPLSSSPPVTPSTKAAAASREVNASDHCTPEASHESAVEPGADYHS